MIGDYLDLLLIALAAWRLSVFVTDERGPFDFMMKIRGRFGVEHDEFGAMTSRPTSGMGQLLTCVWCFSLWAVVIVAALFYFVNILPVFILAAWGMVAIIQAFVNER